MRTSLLTGLLLGALTLTGCTGADDQPAAQSPGTPAAPTTTFAPAPAPGDVADGEVCAQVIAGIDAFNEGDFDETVARFKDALPLAEAADDGSPAAGELLDAVRYYADLPAEDYSEAAATSPDFQRAKDVTLGQCVDDDDDLAPPSGDGGGGLEA